MLEVKTFAGGPFAENSYLAWRSGSSDVVAIDPGAEATAMAQVITEQQLELAAILLTHAHIDHIEGVGTLKQLHPAPTYLHPADRAFYDNIVMQGAQFGLRVEKQPPVEHELAHGQTLQVGGISFEVRHVPGHSPGHVMLYVAAAKAAFVGDVVFQNSIGRTDLPGGDYQLLMRSIREHVMTLPDDTTLYSGHGPKTTVRDERAFNPFIAPSYGGSFA